MLLMLFGLFQCSSSLRGIGLCVILNAIHLNAQRMERGITGQKSV